MHPTEREAFDEQIGILCAGFNVPITDDRREAYWKGLGKMPLISFTRAVEYALGEHGPDKIPTSPQLWALSRAARSTRVDARPKAQESAPQAADRVSLLAQSALLQFIGQQQPSDASLSAMLAAKHKLVDVYRSITSEEQLGDDEIIAAFRAKFLELYAERPASEIDAARERLRRLGHVCEAAA